MKLNEARANWAESAVEHYNGLVKGEKEDALSDLLIDLCHLIERQGGDPSETLLRALEVYGEEAAEESDMDHA